MIFSILVVVPTLANAYLGSSPALSAPSSFRIKRPFFARPSLPRTNAFRYVSTSTALVTADIPEIEIPAPFPTPFVHLDRNALINASILVAVPLLLLSKTSPADIDLIRGWTGAEMAAMVTTKIPMDMWRSYAAALADYPVQTKAATSGAVYALGDYISQKMEGRNIGDMDGWRIARSSAAGFLGHGPLSHLWYGMSESFFQAHPAVFGSWYSVVPKIVLDQTVWGPIWNNMYILLLGAMCFEPRKKILENMKTTTVPLLVSGLKLWPLAHCITYGLVPVEYRLLWVDLVEILWVTTLAATAAGLGEISVEHGLERDDSEGMEPRDTRKELVPV